MTLRELLRAPPVIVKQLVRFGIVGLTLTAINAVIYLSLLRFDVNPYVAQTFAYGIALLFAFRFHGNFTFKGHGSRAQPVKQFARFLVVNLVGYSTNQGFIWLLTVHYGLPSSAAVVPMVLVTPILTFLLQRLWVFR